MNGGWWIKKFTSPFIGLRPPFVIHNLPFIIKFMALPQQVIDSLSHGESKTSGWSAGLLFFSVGIFFLMVIIYFGIVAGYDPFLRSQITSTQTKINNASTSVAATDQAALVNFYSQLSHLQTLLKNHVVFTPFLAWLEENTEANVYYSQVVFSSANQAAVTLITRTQTDLNQQLSIFESAPQVSRVTVSSIAPLKTNGGLWQEANVTLFMNTSLFSSNNI